MKFNAECSRLGPVALVAVASLLSACATVSSEPVVGICPPIVEYSAVFQETAANEVQTLLASSPIVEMLIDYASVRNQLRSCL